MLAVSLMRIKPLISFAYQLWNSCPKNLGTSMEISGGMQYLALIAMCARLLHFFVSFAEFHQQLIAREHRALLEVPFWRNL